jgi:hypothetical protein
LVAAQGWARRRALRLVAHRIMEEPALLEVEADLVFGRSVLSETEAPNVLTVPV